MDADADAGSAKDADSASGGEFEGSRWSTRSASLLWASVAADGDEMWRKGLGAIIDSLPKLRVDFARGPSRRMGVAGSQIC